VISAGQVISKFKGLTNGLFQMRTFAVTLALLILLLIVTVGIYKLVFAVPVINPTPTGKVMATLIVEHKIEDQPIQTPPTAEHPPAHETPTETTPAEPSHEATPENTHEAVHEPVKETPPPTAEAAEATENINLTIEDSVAGLSEDTPDGPLPMIRESDGLKPFDAYKAPFKLKPDTKGVIVLVMVDYGLSDNLSRAALKTLSAPVTYIASPYATTLQPKVSGARRLGNEVWMGLPMQARQDTVANDSGPNGILSGLNSSENLKRLNKQLGRGTGYVGIAINVNPSFAEDAPELQTLINNIPEKGLGIAQLEPSDALIDSVAAQAKGSFAKGDILIDVPMNKDTISKSLARAEKMALDNGHAVATFHPYDC